MRNKLLVLIIFLGACGAKVDESVTAVCMPASGPYVQGLRHRGNTQIGTIRFIGAGHYEFRAGNMSVVPAVGADIAPDTLASVIQVPSAAPLEWKTPGTTQWVRVPLENLTPPQDAEQFAFEGKPLNMRPTNTQIGMDK